MATLVLIYCYYINNGLKDQHTATENWSLAKTRRSCCAASAVSKEAVAGFESFFLCTVSTYCWSIGQTWIDSLCNWDFQPICGHTMVKGNKHNSVSTVVPSCCDIFEKAVCGIHQFLLLLLCRVAMEKKSQASELFCVFLLFKEPQVPVGFIYSFCCINPE